MEVVPHTSASSSSYTDSFLIRIPDGAKSTCELLTDLQQYGDVSRVEWTCAGSGGGKKVADGGSASDNPRSVLVSYFDVRAAERAKIALGHACEPAAAYGHRTLRLLGDASMAEEHSKDVADIAKTEEGDFLVEFFDVRVASQVAASAYAAGGKTKAKFESFSCSAEDSTTAPASDSRCGDRQQPAASSSSAADGSAAASERAHRMRARLNLSSQLDWNKLAAGGEQRTGLVLRGLPKALCDERALRELLKTNGMEGVLEGAQGLWQALSTRSRSQHSLGCMYIKVKYPDDVLPVAKFFHGRQFGGSLPVAVTFAPQKGCGSVAASTAAAPAAAAQEGRGAESRAGRSRSCPQARSDGSTSTAETELEPPPGLSRAKPPHTDLDQPPGLPVPPTFSRAARS